MKADEVSGRLALRLGLPAPGTRNRWASAMAISHRSRDAGYRRKRADGSSALELLCPQAVPEVPVLTLAMRHKKAPPERGAFCSEEGVGVVSGRRRCSQALTARSYFMVLSKAVARSIPLVLSSRMAHSHSLVLSP